MNKPTWLTLVMISTALGCDGAAGATTVGVADSDGPAP